MWKGLGEESQGQLGKFPIKKLKIKKEMAELTGLMTYGPASFFASTAFDQRGRGDVAMLWIRWGRGVERKGRGQLQKIFN